MARLGGAATDKAPKAPKAPKQAKTAAPKPVAKAKPSGGAFVGVDIGSKQMKAVEVKGFGNSLTVTALAIAPTPPNSILNGMVQDPKALGAALKQLIGKNGFRTKRAVTAVTGADGVVVRVIELPRMTPAELAESMKWEVERQVPFPANDIEMAYAPIDDGPVLDPDAPMEVLLAVARRDLVGVHMDTMAQGGLTPVAIDVEALAVGRALIDISKQGMQQKNVVVVNIGEILTEVCIFKQGILRFPRTIPIAGENFSRAIADHLGLSLEAAEDEKRRAAVLMEHLRPASGDFGVGFGDTPSSNPFGDDIGAPGSAANPFDIPSTPAPNPFDNPFDIPTSSATPATDPFGNPIVSADASAPVPGPFDAPQTGSAFTQADVPAPDDPMARRRRELFDALLPVLGELSMEIRRSIDYFRSRYPNDTVDQVIVCGGSAKIGNLAEYLQYDLQYPVMIANPFNDVNLSSKQLSAERLANDAPAFAVALGLAVRDAVLGAGR